MAAPPQLFPFTSTLAPQDSTTLRLADLLRTLRSSDVPGSDSASTDLALALDGGAWLYPVCGIIYRERILARLGPGDTRLDDTYLRQVSRVCIGFAGVQETVRVFWNTITLAVTEVHGVQCSHQKTNTASLPPSA